MGWVVLAANVVLALVLLGFIRETRREWTAASEARAKLESKLIETDKRLDSTAALAAQSEARLDKYFRQLGDMQEQMGWVDSHAHTVLIEPWKRKK